MQALHGVSPAAALIGLIDQLKPWEVASGKWEGTAEQLRAELFQCGSTSTDARRLLEYPQTCGKYLATLVKEEPCA